MVDNNMYMLYYIHIIMTTTTVNTLLYSREGFQFNKIQENQYCLSFQIENPCIILEKIVDMHLIELLYKLNEDLYEFTNIVKIDENSAIITTLMKNLFEDLGLPQRYSHVKVNRTRTSDDIITFTCETIPHIKSDLHATIPEHAELVLIQTMQCDCIIIGTHHMEVDCTLTLDRSMKFVEMVEKIMGLIMFKIFKRLKQFIDNVSI